MKISDFTTNSNQLTESVKNFTDAGIPRDFAEKLVSKFRVKHDAELKPVEGKPRSADIEAGDMLINVLPSGEVIAFMAGYKSRSEYRFIRIRYTTDGELKVTDTDSVAEATSGMSKRGPMFMLKHKGIIGGKERDDKPTPDEIEKRRTEFDPLSGGMYDILNYMNKTFLPRLKPQLEQMVDEIYSNLRKLPKDSDKYGSRSGILRSQRAEALDAAGRIEDIMEKGFTSQTLKDFLKLEGVKISSRVYFRDSWKDVTDALSRFNKEDPLSRAKWAKAFLAGARHYWQMVMDMVDAPVMNALAGESIEETTSAGGIAGVAQPMGKMITRKPRKNKRKKAQEGNKKSPAGGPACWKGKKIHPTKPTKIKGGKRVNNCIDAGTNEEVELDESNGTIIYEVGDAVFVVRYRKGLAVLDLRDKSKKVFPIGIQGKWDHVRAYAEKKANEKVEEVELDEGSREWVIGALAAMGMIGSIAGLDYTAKQALQNDQQLQTLISYYEDAKEAGDRDAMKQLEKRIANQKARIVGGQGPVRDASGTPIVPQRDRTTDARTSNLEEILHGNEFFETYGWMHWPNQITEAEYQGRDVDLDKPVRSTNGPKKFHVYVNSGKKTKDGKIKVKKVNFGDPDMEIKRDDPEARKSFRARHKCDKKTDKTTAGFWSCKKW